MASITQGSRFLHAASTAHGPPHMPYGLGLLTTVASLPPKYRSRYLNIKTKSEIPLDLSVKQISPQIISDVPIAASFTEVYTEPSPTQSPTQGKEEELEEREKLPSSMPEAETVIKSEDSNGCNPKPQQPSQYAKSNAVPESNKPITPPLTPTNKRKYLQSIDDTDLEAVSSFEANANPLKVPKTEPHPTTAAGQELTPVKFIRGCDTAPKTAKNHPPAGKPSRNKATRRLKFDEETSSPVSGTIIRPLDEITDSGVQYSNGDIDPKYNIVEITEETKAELAAIKNVIGDYVCKLCRIKFEDAFCLARHRCACIVLLEYRCPDCGKQFNCPANLASHRRWHKPKKESAAAPTSHKKENRNLANALNKPSKTTGGALDGRKPAAEEEAVYSCAECGRKFKRKAYLRKHKLTHSTSRAAAAAAAAAAAPTSALRPTPATSEATGPTDSLPYYPKSRSGVTSVSSRSSVHSYGGGTPEDEAVFTTLSGCEYESDTLSECSSSNSVGYGRLQIVESGLTEEENIAAAALTNLRNCASVIQHTTLAH